MACGTAALTAFFNFLSDYIKEAQSLTVADHMFSVIHHQSIRIDFDNSESAEHRDRGSTEGLVHQGLSRLGPAFPRCRRRLPARPSSLMPIPQESSNCVKPGAPRSLAPAPIIAYQNFIIVSNCCDSQGTLALSDDRLRTKLSYQALANAVTRK